MQLQAMASPASSSEPADLLAALNSAPKPKRKATEEDLDENASGFRARARREQERYLAATDTEYWCAPCFWTAEACAAFVAALPVPAVDGRWVDGLELAAALSIPVDAEQAEPEQADEVDVLAALQSLAPSTGGLSAEDLLAQLQADALPDPLADVEYTGDLATDSYAELVALAAAIQAADERAERGRLLTDSPHWVVLWFPLRAHKDAFLKAVNMLAFGDKYIDGHRLADVLDIELPAAPPAETEGR
jgi:hypothetical protein